MLPFNYVQLDKWTIIKVSGKDSIIYLNGIVTNDIESISNNTIRSAFLTPKAKIRSIFWIRKINDNFLLYCPKEMREPLIEDLLKFNHNVEVKLDDISEESAQLYLIKSVVKNAPGFDTEDRGFNFVNKEFPPEGMGINYNEFKGWLIKNGNIAPDFLLGENPFEVGFETVKPIL